jgi:hypothetical protein
MNCNSDCLHYYDADGEGCCLALDRVVGTVTVEECETVQTDVFTLVEEMGVSLADPDESDDSDENEEDEEDEDEYDYESDEPDELEEWDEDEEDEEEEEIEEQ